MVSFRLRHLLGPPAGACSAYALRRLHGREERLHHLRVILAFGPLAAFSSGRLFYLVLSRNARRGPVFAEFLTAPARALLSRGCACGLSIPAVPAHWPARFGSVQRNGKGNRCLFSARRLTYLCGLLLCAGLSKLPGSVVSSVPTFASYIRRISRY